MLALTLHSEVQKIYHEEQGARPIQIIERPNTITLWGGLSGAQSQVSKWKCPVWVWRNHLNTVLTLSFCPRSVVTVACPPYQPGNS